MEFRVTQARLLDLSEITFEWGNRTSKKKKRKKKFFLATALERTKKDNANFPWQLETLNRKETQ